MSKTNVVLQKHVIFNETFVGEVSQVQSKDALGLPYCKCVFSDWATGYSGVGLRFVIHSMDRSFSQVSTLTTGSWLFWGEWVSLSFSQVFS